MLSLIRMEKQFLSKKNRQKPKSNYCVTGLYFYDNQGCRVCEESEAKSPRGELEITDLNRIYLEKW